MSGHYDMDGKPIELLEWANKFEHSDRQIDRTWMWFGLVRVSTVWLGLDHDFSRPLDKVNPHPLIFETMIFIHGRGDKMWRYSTKDEAKAGHAAAVKFCRNPFSLIRSWWHYR